MSVWAAVCLAVFGHDESRHAVNGIRASRRSARTVTRFSPEEEKEKKGMNPFMQIRSNDYSWSDMNDGCPVTHSRLRIARPIAKLGRQVRRESFSFHYIMD